MALNYLGYDESTPEGRAATWKAEQAAAVARPAKAQSWRDAPANTETATRIGVDITLSRIVTAQTILATEYPEPKWAVKGLVPEGVTFIAGPPKLGKSIFALNLAVAVAEGGKALSHFDVDQGSVLYLHLEDGPRRLQERLKKLTYGRLSEKLEVAGEWPRLNQGGLDAIDAWIERHKDARLLIVDTLKMLRPLPTVRDRNAYDADYEAIQPLTKIASQRVALMVVHHARKAIADDPLATISGSYGLTGAADGALILKRSRNSSSATLSVIGRDVEEQDLALEFKPSFCLWSVLGKSEEIKRSDERQEVLDLLFQTKELLSPGEVSTLLGKNSGAVRVLLWKMRGVGEVKLFGKKYQLPDFEPPAKNVTSLPVTKKTGNAPKTKKKQELGGERYRVTSLPQETKMENVDGVVTPVTPHLKPSAASGLGALPAKIITGNAVTLSDEEIF